jgi:hypothetical protein
MRLIDIIWKFFAGKSKREGPYYCPHCVKSQLYYFGFDSGFHNYICEEPRCSFKNQSYNKEMDFSMPQKERKQTSNPKQPKENAKSIISVRKAEENPRLHSRKE